MVLCVVGPGRGGLRAEEESGLVRRPGLVYVADAWVKEPARTAEEASIYPDQKVPRLDVQEPPGRCHKNTKRPPRCVERESLRRAGLRWGAKRTLAGGDGGVPMPKYILILLRYHGGASTAGGPEPNRNRKLGHGRAWRRCSRRRARTCVAGLGHWNKNCWEAVQAAHPHSCNPLLQADHRSASPETRPSRLLHDYNIV